MSYESGMRKTWVLSLCAVLLTGCAMMLNTADSGAETDTGDGGGDPDMGLDFSAANICAGKSIFGKVGKAACMAFVDHSLRDKGDTETRLIPDVTKDTDGHYDGQVNQVNNAALNTCGTTQANVEARIEDCADVNELAATWDGAVESNEGHGVWKLVTKTADGAVGKAVWRDERTGLLWSDQLGNLHTTGAPALSAAQQGGNSRTYFGWCFAAGNTQNEDGVNCEPETAGSYNRVEVSLCAEVDGLLTPDGAHDTNQGANAVTAWVEAPDANGSFAILDAKGGMKLAATGTSPSVKWQLPTRGDYLQAYANGMSYVLPRFQDYSFWTSSIRSDYPGYAWYFVGYATGAVTVGTNVRDNYNVVRCVGR